MKTPKKVLRYVEENMQEVLHTTLNPEGPGVIRIHLIPPKCEAGEVASSIAIINGQDIVPVNTSWSILLSEFIREVNTYNGREITEEDGKVILENTCKRVRKVYTLLSKKIIKRDLYTIMETFSDIARGKVPKEPVDYISLGDYAPYMRAPHRMDLLVSAMVKDGKWHCNQNCIHCYAAGQELVSEEELSTEEWKRIIDKCRQVCIPQVTFTGGEPTMREDLFELIDYASFFVTRLNTNGIRLTEAYCKKLMESSLDSCQITFYSCEEAIHNTLVGAPQYEKTLAGIENAVKAGLNVSINTPLCTLNRDYVKTLEFLHQKGILYVTCSGLITTGNACTEQSEALQLTSEEMEALFKEAIEYCHANGMEISFTSPGWVGDELFDTYGLAKPVCGACLSNMAVTPGGNVVPCQSDLNGEPLGNMLRDDWESIWNHPDCELHRAYSARQTGECPLRRRKANEEK